MMAFPKRKLKGSILNFKEGGGFGIRKYWLYPFFYKSYNNPQYIVSDIIWVNYYVFYVLEMI